MYKKLEIGVGKVKKRLSVRKLCDVKNLPGPHILKDAHKVSPIRKIMPAFWRFFTTLDPQVNLFTNI